MALEIDFCYVVHRRLTNFLLIKGKRCGFDDMHACVHTGAQADHRAQILRDIGLVKREPESAAGQGPNPRCEGPGIIRRGLPETCPDSPVRARNMRLSGRRQSLALLGAPP